MVTFVNVQVLKRKRLVVLAALFLAVFAGNALGAPPVITLNFPDNHDSTSNSFMDMSVTVSADEYPVTVFVYGDTLGSPADLIHVTEGIMAETTIPFSWSALPLAADANSVGLWHFDEIVSDAVVDASGSGNDGSFVSFAGGPTLSENGRFGYGIGFNGTSEYITIPDLDNSLDVDPTTGILTMEAWIFPHSSSGGIYRAFLSKRSFTVATSVNYALYLDDNTGALTMYNGTFTPGAGWYESNIVAPTNQWSYVVVSLDASEGMLRFYYNGVIADSISGAVFGPVNDADLTLGVSITPSGGRFFDGVVDDIHMTKRLLTDAEIANNYQLKRDDYSWQVEAVDNMSDATLSEIRDFTVGLELDPISDVSVAEGDNVIIDVSAANPDGATIALTTSALPTNAIWADNGDGTGSIDFTPDYDQLGSYGITVTADDGIENVFRTFNLDVTNTNRAPVVSDIPDQTVGEGSSFTTIDLSGFVTDPDVAIDDAIAWTYSGNVELTVDITADVATITIPNSDWNGAETVTFRATDLNAEFGEDDVLLTVTGINDAPIIDDVTDKDIGICNYLEFGISASDIDGVIAGLTATLSPSGNLPTGALFTDYGDGTGLFAWTPGATQAGAYALRFTAVDDSGATDYDDMTITVHSDTIAPVISLTAPADDAMLSDPYATLSADVSDDSPLTIKVFGGYASDALNLLSVTRNVTDPDVTYDWNTPIPRIDPANTIGVWHFDENTGATAHDASSMGNDGQLLGQLPLWSPDGRFGYAVDFNGDNNYLHVPGDASLNIDSATGAITIEAWIYPRNDGNDNRRRGLVAKQAMAGPTAPCNYQMFLDEDGNLGFSSNGVGWSQEHASSVAIPFGEWSYVAVTLNAADDRAHFYRNGVLSDEIDGVAFAPANDGILTIGTSGRLLECFNGYMDEVRITRRELTDTEISNNYSHIGGGLHFWKIAATDCANNTTVSEVRSFTIGDANDPTVMLISPANGAVAVYPHMEIKFDVIDESPVTYMIYGDATPSATDLLCAGTGAKSCGVVYDWTAAPLEPEPPFTAGLWNFDQASGTTVTDNSYNGNTGTLMNGPLRIPDGRFGRGIDFDGINDYITIPDINNSLDVNPVTGALTMEAWIHPDSLGEGIYRAIISKRDRAIPTMVNYALYLDQTDGALTLYNGNYVAGDGYYISSVIPPLHEWSYVAVSLNATEGVLRFYLNGELKDEISGASFGPTHDAELTIGASRTSAGDRCFDGRIDDVRLTKRVLSDEEIEGNFGLTKSTYFWRVIVTDAFGNEVETAIRYFTTNLFVCGDANGDEHVNVGDAVFIISYAFRGGPAPDPIEAGDANCDGHCNIGDAVFIISYAFRGGPAPCTSCP